MTESSYKYLYRIDSPADLRKLSQQELVGYCDELRRFIIEQLALNPGHLGSSLGVVEQPYYYGRFPKTRLRTGRTPSSVSGSPLRYAVQIVPQ